MAETCRQPNKTDTKTAVVEELKTNLMSLVIFYFTYYLLNMFRTLICPSSGACDCVDGLPHRLFCSLIVVLGFAAGVVWWCPVCRLKH